MNRLHYPAKSDGIPFAVPNDPLDSEILTIKEVSQYLKVTERTIYWLAAAKRVPGFKVGGAWRFSKAEIDQWIRRQSEVGASDDEAAITGATK